MPIAEVARRVGNSPEVIHRRYHGCIDGHEEAANSKILSALEADGDAVQEDNCSTNLQPRRDYRRFFEIRPDLSDSCDGATDYRRGVDVPPSRRCYRGMRSGLHSRLVLVAQCSTRPIAGVGTNDIFCGGDTFPVTPPIPGRRVQHRR
ncbi:hypothetical protein [Streptomyces flavofungini]|uniref:hypothetical protein n=1 Tax=Streptomyces flavofungini TaxID=68200 RepID=UPI003F53F904